MKSAVTILTASENWTKFKDWSSATLPALAVIAVGTIVVVGLVVLGKKGLDKHYRKSPRNFTKR